MTGTIIRALLFMGAGVGLAALFYYAGNLVATRLLPRGLGQKILPWIFVLPAMFVVGVYLLYPLIDTVRQTFYADRFVDGEKPFVGFENYEAVLTDPNTWSAVWNNVLWIIDVPAGAVAIGLLGALLADKLKPKAEST